ncbi:MAG: acetyl-CoA carboxylase, biotin carboxyl carrier protein, partial [Patescibacteria group bacterium]|nr:acetyl-CoA carboxylase, biotin carboxyl carrier protein [Patescibacteria group bacterium]
MAGSLPNQDVFDVRKVRQLVVLMKEHDLTELEIQQGETRIQLRRGFEPVMAVSAVPVAPAPIAAAPPA